LDKLVKERAKVYGNPKVMHQCIAKCWSALLGVEIKDWQVALMMVLFKVMRMKYVFKQDNFDDVKVYLSFAEKWQKD
jgi:hypothetical protein